LILGSRGPVRDHRRRYSNPRRVCRGADSQSGLQSYRGSYRSSPDRLRPSADYLHRLVGYLLVKPPADLSHLGSTIYERGVLSRPTSGTNCAQNQSIHRSETGPKGP
jgi:hypothetical protein